MEITQIILANNPWILFSRNLNYLEAEMDGQ